MPETRVLATQFDDLEQQHEAAGFGMWVFLGTEIMFFGGMFAGYTIYRACYFPGFAEGSRLCNIVLGGINTVVLLTSSLTMALAVHAAQVGRRKTTVTFLLLTVLLGLVFLGIKFTEYHQKWEEQLVPGLNWAYSGPHARQVWVFISFYFGLTGFHALHMIIGVVLVLIIAHLAWRGKYSADYYSPVEVTGLYWHFVDIVWIFLYPLLYLVDRHP